MWKICFLFDFSKQRFTFEYGKLLKESIVRGVPNQLSKSGEMPRWHKNSQSDEISGEMFSSPKKTLHIWTYKGQFRTIVLIKLLHTSLILNKRIAKLSSISGAAVGDERVTKREDITGDYCKICNQEFYQMKVKSRKNHIRNHMKRSKRTKSPHWGGRWKWKWGYTVMASDPEYWVSSLENISAVDMTPNRVRYNSFW